MTGQKYAALAGRDIASPEPEDAKPSLDCQLKKTVGLDREALLGSILVGSRADMLVDRFVSGPHGQPHLKILLGHSANKAKLNTHLLQLLIEKGAGLVVFHGSTTEPHEVYDHRDLLTWRVFGSLRMQKCYDPEQWPETADLGPPAGTTVTAGYPSEQLLPQHTLQLIRSRVSEALGQAVSVEPQIESYGGFDGLYRFRFVVKPVQSEDARKKVAGILSWFLPYAIYLTAKP